MATPEAEAEHARRKAVIEGHPLVWVDGPETYYASHRLVVRASSEADVRPHLQGLGMDRLRDWHLPAPDPDPGRRAALASLETAIGLVVYEGLPYSAVAALESLRTDLLPHVGRVPYVTLAPHDMGPSGPVHPVEPGRAPGRLNRASLSPNATPLPGATVDLVVLDTGTPSSTQLAAADWTDPAIAAIGASEAPDPLYTGPDDLDEVGVAGHGLFVAAVATTNTCDAVLVTSHRSSDFILSTSTSLLKKFLFPGAFSLGTQAWSIATLVSSVEIGADLWLARQAATTRMVVNMSFGGYFTCKADMDFLAVAMATVAVDENGEIGPVVFCAAAGNKADLANGVPGTQPVYPAAYATDSRYPELNAVVVSVGALDTATGPASVAEFSGRGSWVLAWANGVDVVGPYVPGTWHNDRLGDLDFAALRPFGRWSGTSFATPKVAAAVATHALAGNLSPVEAWGALKAPTTTVEWVDSGNAAQSQSGTVI